MSGLLFELRGGKSSSHPSQKGAQEALLFFWVAGAPPARDLTPVPSPIALPPTGRGGLSWSGGARSRRYQSDRSDPSDRSDAAGFLSAPPPQQGPPLPVGRRAMGEGTGVRFRAGGEPRPEFI